MRAANRWMTTTLVLAALACAPNIEVTSRTEPGVDFTHYATYALVPPPDARTAVREILEKDIGDALDARGYRAVPIGQSDLLVVIQTKAQPKQRQVFADSPGGCCVVQTYVAGTLTIEIFDAKSSGLVWHGHGEVDISKASEKEIDEAASEAAAAILAKLPKHTER